MIHKKNLVGGALEVLLVYFWLMASKEVLPKKKIKKKYVIHKTTLLGGALEVIHTCLLYTSYERLAATSQLSLW